MEPYSEESSKEQERGESYSPSLPEGLFHKTQNFTADKKYGSPPNSFNKPQAINSAAAAGKTSAGSAAGSGTAAATGSVAGNVAGGTASAATTGAGSGAATGAAAGSIAPGAGTAVGAAIGAAGGTAAGAAKKGQHKNCINEVPPSSESKVRKKSFENSGTKTTTLDDSLAVKIVIFTTALLLALALTLVVILDFFIGGIASPVMLMFKKTASHKALGSQFIEDCGTAEPSYEEIVNCFCQKLQNAMEKAYIDTCYKEVYQIAVEQGYDLDLTLASYHNTEIPYFFNGEKCNVNYAEIMYLISMSPEYKVIYTQFDYLTFCDLLNQDEFLRCLYDLNIIKTEKKIFTGHLESGESGIVHQDGTVVITHPDLSTSTYTGKAAEAYYKTVLYGEVYVNHYPLKKLYNFFNVDPYGKNETIPSMTNQQAIGNLEYMARLYYETADWGSSQRTPLSDYKKYTGILNYDVQNVYEKDVQRYSNFSGQEIYMDMPEYKQNASAWGSLPYASSTISKLGCCLTSMSMVCTYFTGESITPDILNTYIRSSHHGELYRDLIAAHYGFHQYTDSASFNTEAVKGELVNNRLIIAHIRGGALGTGKYGHFVVLNGFSSEKGCYYVKEPAGRLSDTVSMAQAAEVFDAYRSYGF